MVMSDPTAEANGAPTKGALCALQLGLGALALLACTFEPPPAGPPPGPRLPFGLLIPPLAPLVESSSTKEFEDPGSLVAHHGIGCAESDRSNEPVTLLVRQSQEIPSTLSHAAVILNGWHFTYLNGDHEVLGLATGLFDIQRSVRDDGSHLLEWQAFGVIRDGGYDDPFRWCYHFTVVAWDGAAYAAQVDQRDARGSIGDAQGREVPFGWQTALSFHPSFVEAYPAGSAVAMILPRGFGFAWPERNEDHNLLQLAYNLDPGAPFIADGRQYSTPSPALDGADRAGRTYYSWDSKTVFKDNAPRRPYLTGELVSVAAGAGLEAVQPPFTIVPFEDQSGICAALVQDGLDQRRVNGLPYEVAIPVLTGWELSYGCDDAEVEEIGAWVGGFDYAATTSELRSDGVLAYSVRTVLHDQGGVDVQHSRYRVGVLGFRKQPPLPPAPSLDVLPEVLRFPYPDHRGRPATTRNALLTNFGSAPAERLAVAVVGSDASAFQLVSQHPSPQTLAPGGDELFTVRFVVPCGASGPSVSLSAALRIDTTEGRFEVPLMGQSYPCATSAG
jgi:hypothetical protein